MSWIAVGVGLGGAALGAMNQQEQRDQKKRELMANAEAIKMSPWTGMKPEMQGMGGMPSTAMGAMQGGLTGAMMGSQFAKAGAPAAPQTQVSGDPSVNSLGGQDMANQLGAQSSQFQASMQGKPVAPDYMDPNKRNTFFAANNPYAK